MIVDIETYLRTEDGAALVRGLARGQYNVLLGAGASAGSLDRRRNPLPLADDLASRLYAEFEIPSAAAPSLSRAYGAAKRRSAEVLGAYLADLFCSTSPADWWADFCAIEWARLWTLNIDDVAERAFEVNVAAARQKLMTVDWTAPFVEPDRSRDELQIVHLHGSACGPRPSRELVFDIREYLHASAHHTWHAILGDQFPTSPFLVVGAKLVEEFDLVAILSQGSESLRAAGLPSAVLLRTVDPLEHEELQSFGLRVVQGTADDFFRRVRPLVQREEFSIAQAAPGAARTIPPEFVRFSRQFAGLALAPARRASGSDFYAGFDPQWDDILANRDAQFVVTLETRDLILDANRRGAAQMVCCIEGPAFSGKTTALYRIARALLGEGYSVYEFRGRERVDVAAVRWLVQHQPRTALLFDGLADDAPDIQQIAEECRAGGIRLTIVATERSGRMAAVRHSIAREFLRDEWHVRIGQLSELDASRLIQVFHQAGRLGRLTRSSRRDRIHYFLRESGGNLFDALSGLEGGLGFRQRFRKLYESVESPQEKRAYALACLVYALGYRSEPSLLAAGSGLRTRALVRAVDEGGGLQDLLFLKDGLMRPQHRRVASLFVEDVLTRSERMELLQSLARELAPYVNRNAIRQRTLPYRIVRALMDYRIVGDWIGSESLETFYGSLVEQYEWNARFWEQRALGQASLERFDLAESYAERAVQTYEDAYTLTTLGSILMRKSVEWVEPGTAASFEYFRRAEAALQAGRGRARPDDMRPYQTFIMGSLRLARTLHERAGQLPSEEMRRAWQDWYIKAQLVRERLASDEPPIILDARHQEWIELASGARPLRGGQGAGDSSGPGGLT